MKRRGLGAHAGGLFGACLPRRGRKAANDRLFLEADALSSRWRTLRWRALPERFTGPWNVQCGSASTRLSKAGVLRGVLRHAGITIENTSRRSDPDVSIPPDRCAAHVLGGRAQEGARTDYRMDINASTGSPGPGSTTKIHAKCRVQSGSHDRFDLTGRREADAPQLRPSSSYIDRTSRPVPAIGHKGYVSKRETGSRSPPRSQRHRPGHSLQ